MKFENETHEETPESAEGSSSSPLGYNDTFADICVVSKEEYLNGTHVKSFTTSQVEQSAQLKTYLQDLLTIPFNTYCVDCKEERTTHAIVWLGAFVCKKCADDLLKTVGGNHHVYIKDIFKEHWDDYQLNSMTKGGNKSLFKIMKEYGVQHDSLANTYNEPCIIWYRNMH